MEDVLLNQSPLPVNDRSSRYTAIHFFWLKITFCFDITHSEVVSLSIFYSSSSVSKRANRTRFSDYQVKTLNDYFEQNAYPKDEELELLSRRLQLPNRVIVVWFQNNRQKARKVSVRTMWSAYCIIISDETRPKWRLKMINYWIRII